MTWITNATTREGILALLPRQQALFNKLYASLWQLPHLPGSVLELCRLRIAQMHQSATEWQRQECAIADDQRQQLSQWHCSESFSDAERACLDITEVYVMDPQAITDEQAAAVKRHFGDAGLVALVEALGLFYGLTRLGILWGLAPQQGPETAQAQGRKPV